MRLDSDYSPAFVPFIYLFFFGGTSATCTVYLWDMNSACRPVNNNPHVNSNFIIIIIIFSFQLNKKALHQIEGFILLKNQIQLQE